MTDAPVPQPVQLDTNKYIETLKAQRNAAWDEIALLQTLLAQNADTPTQKEPTNG